MAASTFNHSEM